MILFRVEVVVMVVAVFIIFFPPSKAGLEKPRINTVLDKKKKNVGRLKCRCWGSRNAKTSPIPFCNTICIYRVIHLT